MALKLENGHGETPPPPRKAKKIHFEIGAEKSPLMRNSERNIFTFEANGGNKKEKLRVELYDLHSADKEWVETARWIRYEQDVEGKSQHWSRPHVGPIYFDSISILRPMIAEASVLETDPNSYSELVDIIAHHLNVAGWTATEIEKVMELLRLQQTHVNTRNLIKNFTSNGLNKLASTLQMSSSNMSLELIRNHSVPAHVSRHGDPHSPKAVALRKHSEYHPRKHSEHHRKHTSTETITDSAHVLAGVVPEMEKNRLIFVRLSQSTYFPEIHLDDIGTLEGSSPMKFLVFMLGPQQNVSFHEIGRAFSTMLSNEFFRPYAYQASSAEELTEGVNLFLENSAIIAGSRIDNEKLIQVDRLFEELNEHAQMKKTQAVHLERRPTSAQVQPVDTALTYKEKKKRTGKFVGLRDDFCSRLPHYWSDFTDAWDPIVLKSLAFMFLACITPTVTFGGLMGEKTNDRMGMAETLIAQSIFGIIWGLFAVQPIMVQSPTGPVLIFEGALCGICNTFGLDLLTVKLYTGFWIFLIAFLVVCFDLQRILRYVTKFTEEIFAALISLIFISESLKYIKKMFRTYHPMDSEGYKELWMKCNESMYNFSETFVECDHFPEPNTALLSLILLISTAILALFLRYIRESQWLGRDSRKFCGDYSVAAALLVIVLANQLLFPHIFVERLEMPESLGFTNPAKRRHGLVVSPYTEEPLWVLGVSLVAAVLVFILIFVETGITELVLARKERKLVKGSGESWDMLLAGLCCLLSSTFGLPWMCAGAVQSIAHANSLTIKEKFAPGERPVPVRVVEQRVSTILLALLIGLFGVVGQFFKFLPTACLFGVFTYLGITSLFDLDLFSRIFLMFKPSKYHPKCAYVDEVSTDKMHLFTLIQIVLTGITLLTKFFTPSALFFPFILCILVGIRLSFLPCIFTSRELSALDEGHEKEGHQVKDPEVPLLV